MNLSFGSIFDSYIGLSYCEILELLAVVTENSVSTMDVKKITRIVVFLCIFSAVLAMKIEHGKHARIKKSLDTEEASMHPRKIYKTASASGKDSSHGAVESDTDPDSDVISETLEDLMRRMEMDDSGMHDPPTVKKSSRPAKGMDLDDKDMHPRRTSTSAKESPRKADAAPTDDSEISQILDDDFMRRMEIDDSDMHDPPKIKKSSGPMDVVDLDDMYPRLGVNGVPAPEDEMAADDPAIKNMDLFSILGQDILQQIEFDDSVMHPRRVAKQTSTSSSKSRAPEMDDRDMHPHFANKGQQKDFPVVEPVNHNDFDIPTELEEDFMQQFEMDDSLMHPADVRGERKKSSYFAGKDNAGLHEQMHPKAVAPQQQDGSEDVVSKDADTVADYNLDDVLGYDFMQRMEVDDSEMHDPNGQLLEDADEDMFERRGSSRRLLSLGNGDDKDDGEAKTNQKIGSLRSQFTAGLGFPLHASCKLNWVFGVNCSSVSKALNQQITKWSGPDGCNDGGEKCLYKLLSSNETTLLATHETPQKHYVDDLSFQFTPKGSDKCAVYGFSTSETWYAVLDKGTNYCNLHNLITGSGLDKTTDYKESTSDDICTQYSSADCDVY